MKEEIYYCVEPDSYIKSFKCSTLLFPTLEQAFDFLKKSFVEFPSQGAFVIRKVVVMI